MSHSEPPVPLPVGDDDEDNEPIDPVEAASFAQFLQQVEDELAKYTDEDHRRAMIQILIDGGQMEAARKMAEGAPDEPADD